MSATYKRIRTSSQGELRPAVFLDRDGVLIEDTGFISHPDQIRHIPGSAEAVARLNRAGITVALVTNQSGVGRGYYSWQDFEAVQGAIETRLAAEGAWLDGVWACGYDPETAGVDGENDHPWRKPNPGMIQDAALELGLSVELSWMAGDRLSDVQAGLRAGVQRVIQISDALAETGQAEAHGVVRCTDLASAVELILSKTGLR